MWCVGCGYCCWKVRCGVGIDLHGHGDKCPELMFKDGRHWCGVLLGNEEDLYTAWLRTELSVGEGCCSTMNSWRREPLQDRTNFTYPSIS